MNTSANLEYEIQMETTSNDHKYDDKKRAVERYRRRQDAVP